jgi:hypothetical protein
MGVRRSQVLLFLIYPRRVIRDLIGTRPWRVVTAFSLMIGMISCIAIAEMPAGDIPERFKPVAIALVFICSSLLTVVGLFINGLMRNRSGREFGGRASAWDLSAGLAWSTLPWLLYFVLGLVMGPYLAEHQEFGKNHLGLAYFLLALAPICLFWGYLLGRSSMLELQGFSAAQGRTAAWKGVALQMRWFLFFALAALGILTAITLIGRVLR